MFVGAYHFWLHYTIVSVMDILNNDTQNEKKQHIFYLYITKMYIINT